jgi:acyl carrier protein
VADLREEILAEIVRTLSTDLESRVPVELHSELAADLQVDSVGTVVLAVALEDRFRVKLTGTDASAVVSVGDLVDLVERAVRQGEGGIGSRWEGGRPP